MHQHRLRHHHARINPADAMDIDKAILDLAHHQADLVHVRRQHDLAPLRCRAGGAFDADQTAQPVAVEFIDQIRPVLAQDLGDRRFVTAGRMGFHQSFEMFLWIVHGLILPQRARGFTTGFTTEALRAQRL